MMTDDEIKALLEGCEGWRPGPWARKDINYYAIEGEGWKCGVPSPYLEVAHIARCDPGTIAELCTRLLAAEALNKDFRKELAQAIANSSRFEEDRKVLQARVKLLQDALRHISRDTELDHIGDRWQTRIAVYAQEVLEALAE